MRIKTRESLRSIKTFDRAESLAQKSKNGIASLHDSAEQTQNVGYESETDYAGNELQTQEERIVRGSIYGAEKVGRWGLRETKRNIYSWRSRSSKIKPKSNPNPKLKQLFSPQRKALSGSANNGVKTTAKTAKAATKQAVKTSTKVARLAKKAAVEAVRFTKAAAKAIVTGVKATAAAVKGVVAAIAAGGWIAVLVIVIIIVIAAVIGSVYAIFVPPDKDSEITVQSVISDLENEWREKQAELISNCQYDVLSYDGSLAEWNEVVAVYAVKLNLDSDNPQEVATFDEEKAEELKNIFWVMNSVSASTRSETKTVTKYVPDGKGNMIEKSEEITTVYLTVKTENMSAEEAAEHYEFNDKQRKMLDELLSENNAEMWEAFLTQTN